MTRSAIALSNIELSPSEANVLAGQAAYTYMSAFGRSFMDAMEGTKPQPEKDISRILAASSSIIAAHIAMITINPSFSKEFLAADMLRKTEEDGERHGEAVGTHLHAAGQWVAKKFSL